MSAWADYTMATSEEVDHTAVDGSDKELPAQEDAGGEQPYSTPDRRHVDALLDISEEDFLKDLEPYEYHCYSGWEEAVSEWISSLLPAFIWWCSMLPLSRLYQLHMLILSRLSVLCHSLESVVKWFNLHFKWNIDCMILFLINYTTTSSHLYGILCDIGTNISLLSF